LFSDDGEVIFDAQRPVIINGIAEVIVKSDLLDRAILVYLPTIPKGKRWKKRVLNRKFIEAQPLILGALLDAVSAGLRRMREGIEMDEWPRMSDFAEWAIACEKALGLESGDFIKAYTKNISRADDLAIEASALAQEVLALLDEENGAWDGTTGELIRTLNGRLEKRNENPKNVDGWPRSGKGLRNKLKELAPNLRRLGVEVAFGARGAKGYSLRLSRRKPEPAPDSDPPSSEVRSDVHEVHKYTQPNGFNSLESAHSSALSENGSQGEVHTADDGAHSGGSSALSDSELSSEVHTKVHTVNGCEQRASVHSAHSALPSEPPERESRKRVSI
jgi:hypothetical protein